MSRITQSFLVRFTAAIFFTASSASAALPSVSPGFELFKTITGTTYNGVPFEGVPLGTFDFGPPANVQSTGNTDTIIKRLAPAVPPTIPGTAPPIAIQLVALQLVSTAPTDFGLGTDFYYITLQSVRGGPASTGNMTINFDNTGNAGTFNSFFDIFYDIRKGSLSGPITLSNDVVATTSADAAWARTAPAGTLTIPDVNFNLNGFNENNDFFPAPITVTWPAVAFQNLDNANPEPASLGLLFFGTTACLLRRRK